MWAALKHAIFLYSVILLRNYITANSLSFAPAFVFSAVTISFHLGLFPDHLFVIEHYITLSTSVIKVVWEAIVDSTIDSIALCTIDQVVDI